MVDSPTYKIPTIHCLYRENKFDVTKESPELVMSLYTSPLSILSGESTPSEDGTDILKIEGCFYLTADEIKTITIDREELENLMMNFVSNYFKPSFVTRIPMGYRWYRTDYKGECYDEFLLDLLPFLLGKKMLEAIPGCENLRNILSGPISQVTFTRIGELFEMDELPDMIEDHSLYEAIFHHLKLLARFGGKYSHFFHSDRYNQESYDDAYLVKKCFYVLRQKVERLSTRLDQLERSANH